VEVPLDSDIPTVAKQLATRPGVLSAQPDFLREAAGIAIDPLYPLQWSLNMIKAPQAWDEMMLIGGARPKVAVLDTGFDTLHPDLILVWSTTINALNDHPTNRDDVSDNPDHGTKVTGALAALGDNAYGIAGVNKDWADLILVKVFGAKVNGKDVTSDTLVMKGISLLPTETRVVNLSLAGAGPRPSALCDAIASRSDLLFVAAAGNNHDENPYYPAACGSENLIAVASSNSSDTLAQSSNWGLWVDLAAPGVGIWTTTPYSLFGSVDGTSMAAPHVSGVASMIFSKTPSMSPSAVRNQIRNTVDDYKHLEVSTGGRLNACRALGGC
jgi:subtilisin family serine protease